jgi:hypothetical protein
LALIGPSTVASSTGSGLGALTPSQGNSNRWFWFKFTPLMTARAAIKRGMPVVALVMTVGLMLPS